VDLVFCDLPHVPPGAMGRFLLTQMASMAELEARGVKVGNPNGAPALRGKRYRERAVARHRNSNVVAALLNCAAASDRPHIGSATKGSPPGSMTRSTKGVV
jgi:hypothetical protein